MPAKIICVCNQKGGSGKTTIAMHLAGSLSLRKKKVIVIDGDEQGSAVEWASLAPEGVPFPSKVCSLAKAGRKIHQEIKKFIEDFNFIIVDCPPAAESPIAKSSLLVADLALVPFIPGALDMLASVLIRNTIDDVKVLNPDLKSKLLINRIEPQTTLTQTVLELIPNFNMEILKSKIHKRTAYGEAVLSGTIVHCLKKKSKEAIQEIEDLTDEILEILEQKTAGE
jgi:chromosome partitioning protein